MDFSGGESQTSLPRNVLSSEQRGDRLWIDLIPVEVLSTERTFIIVFSSLEKLTYTLAHGSQGIRQRVHPRLRGWFVETKRRPGSRIRLVVRVPDRPLGKESPETTDSTPHPEKHRRGYEFIYTTYVQNLDISLENLMGVREVVKYLCERQPLDHPKHALSLSGPVGEPKRSARRTQQGPRPFPRRDVNERPLVPPPRRSDWGTPGH